MFLRRTSVFIIAIFVLELALPYPVSLAAVSNPTTLVVQATHDGVSDEASDKTATLLREKLKAFSELTIIAPKKVETVLTYYKNYQTGNLGAPEEVKSLLSRAKEHYYNFAYRESASLLQRIFHKAKADPRFIIEAGFLLREAWVTFALVDVALGKKKKALRDFQEVLKLDPSYSLDPKGYAPSLRSLFRKAKRSLNKEARAALYVEANPKVSQVFLNGIYKGVTPLTLQELPVGEYALRVQATNYQTFYQEVSLEAGEKAHLYPKLFWNPKKRRSRKHLAKTEEARLEIEAGVRIGHLLKVDKVLLVNVDDDRIVSRVIDRRYRSAYHPIVVSLDSSPVDFEENINRLVQFILAQTQIDLLKHAKKHLDPQGIGDPILLGRKRRKISKKVLFGGLGTIAVGGLLAGILGAGNGGTKVGTLTLNFK